jgi:hypothetical protein
LGATQFISVARLIRGPFGKKGCLASAASGGDRSHAFGRHPVSGIATRAAYDLGVGSVHGNCVDPISSILMAKSKAYQWQVKIDDFVKSELWRAAPS